VAAGSPLTLATVGGVVGSAVGADVGARVDEDRGAALPVGDHKGVRQPVGMHAPLHQHGARLTGTPEEEKEWPV